MPGTGKQRQNGEFLILNEWLKDQQKKSYFENNDIVISL